MPTDDSFKVFDGSQWRTVGTSGLPLNVRLANHSWKKFAGGGGDPLKVRMPNKTWRVVATAGDGHLGSVSGYVRWADGTPAINKTITVGGRPDKTTTTDDTGAYHVVGLDYTTYLVQANADATHDVFGTVVLSAAHPDATLDLQFTPEQSNFITYFLAQFQQNSGFYCYANHKTSDLYTPSPDQTISQPVGAPGRSIPDNLGIIQVDGLPLDTRSRAMYASSIRGSGLMGPESDHFESFRSDSVSWISVPVKDLRDWAALYSPARPYPTGGLDHVEYIRVTFTLQGFALIKHSLPGRSDFLLASTTAGQGSGDGALVYQGFTPTESIGTYTYNPDLFFNPTPHSTTMPIVRDKTLVKEPGITLWSGGLNDLAETAPGSSAPYTQISHILPPNYSADAAQYQIWTSQADESAPVESHSDPANTNFNYLCAGVSVQIVFRGY